MDFLQEWSRAPGCFLRRIYKWDSKQFQSLHHHLIDINIDVIIIDVIIIDVNIKVVVAINDDHDFCRKEKGRWVICWPT